MSEACIVVGSFRSGHEDAFFNNTCVTRTDGDYAFFSCDGPSLPIMHDNRVCTPSGASFRVCGKDFKEWQAAGHDAGSVLSGLPADDELIGWGAVALGLPSQQDRYGELVV
ncbi:unnamed protein product [Prorocentrum cordatum]|uniref:Uncharacterized protein n=1 Tax=Prorocentrum cordatum TaxID=2364126 RepID=A0ABN9TIY7_9DINO|nr:unnamed protein product [Polarella glacialis]